MKKILHIAFAAVVLLSGTAFAQSTGSECQNSLKRAKQAYHDLGAAKTKRLFDMIIKNCDKATAAQARAWLQEQKNREAEAKRKKQEQERRKRKEEQARIEAENRKREEEQLKQKQEQARRERANNNLNAISSQGISFTINGETFNMIKVEGGTFQMGATSEQESDAEYNERPVHSVTLSDYYIGQTEVTQELWEAVMGENPSAIKRVSQHPVENVSWEDCQEFIKKLNQLTGQSFRLPTEAEWEFAARGGNNSRGYKYSGSNTVGSVAWYGGNSGSKTHAVATKQANELGLYDMSGNVWEWCSDWKGTYPSSAQTNPKGPSKGGYRVLRGGSWYFNAGSVRVSYRHNGTPSSRISSYGLRLAL